MLFETDDGLRERFDLGDVQAFFGRGTTGLGRFERRIQGEGRVETLEGVVEPLEPHQGKGLPGPRGLVSGVEPQRAVVGCDREVETSRAVLRGRTDVPQPFVVREGLRRLREGVGGRGELFQLHVKQAFRPPRVTKGRRGLDRRFERAQRLI